MPPPRPVAAGADWSAALQQVLALHRAGQLDAAEPLYRQLLHWLPDNPDLLHFHGLLLFQRGQCDQALAQVRRSVTLKPQVAAWHNNLGNMLLAQQQAEEAAACYQRCLALQPDNLEVRNNLACLLRQQGRLQAARALLDDAVQRAPAWCEAHANLAVVLAQQGDQAAALHSGLQALALQPADARTRQLLGQLFTRCGRADLAAQVFRDALAAQPDDPAARHHLAAVTGEQVPARAADAYVQQLFDRYATSFDASLGQLGYQAPALCDAVLQRRLGAADGRLEVLDAGCGTGLCGPLLRPRARRLTGLDLSPGMLAQARQRGCHDRLVQAELGAWLAGCGERFDLIVCADTLCYFGPLGPVLAAARRVVQAPGWLVFTVEAADALPAAAGPDTGCRLLPHGRYAHSRAAVLAWLAGAGWQAAECAPVVLRQEAGQPVQGWLVSACAAPADACPSALLRPAPAPPP